MLTECEFQIGEIAEATMTDRVTLATILPHPSFETTPQDALLDGLATKMKEVIP